MAEVLLPLYLLLRRHQRKCQIPLSMCSHPHSPTIRTRTTTAIAALVQDFSNLMQHSRRLLCTREYSMKRGDTRPLLLAILAITALHETVHMDGA